MGKSEYQGYYIPESVIIVENHKGQGFVVPKGNDKIMETAINWADCGDYIDGRYVKKPGTLHEYENGKFVLEFQDAAAKSWGQGGKLSFWNCLITAPDNKKFLVGINSTELCTLIKGTDIKKGRVCENVYLGRRSGNVCALTSSMPEFALANDDKEKRTKSTTVKYEPGDIIESLTQTDVYVGEVYKLFDVDVSYRYGNIYVQINVYNTPVKQYMYVNYNRDELDFSSYHVDKKKLKRIKTGDKISISFDKIKESVLAKCTENRHKHEERIKQGYRDGYYLRSAYTMYLDLIPKYSLDSNRKLTEDEILEIKKNIIRQQFAYSIYGRAADFSSEKIHFTVAYR